MNTTLNRLIAGAAAGLMLVAGTGAAMAYPGHATASVNVRTGPSVGYRVVDQLYPGERVNVRRCRSGWCFVTHPGPDGWVSANYLSRSHRRAPPVYVQPPVYNPPPIVIRPPYFPGFPHRPPHGWGDHGGRGDHHGGDHGGRGDHHGGPGGHNGPGSHNPPPPNHNPRDVCRIHPDWRICRNHTM